MKKDVYRLLGIAAVLITAMVLGAAYYVRAQKAQRAAQLAKEPPPSPQTLVRPHSHILGPKDAKVTVVEFLDPECESCRAMYPLVKQLMGQYPNGVRLVIRYMPLHPNSMYAVAALEAAAQQDRFWEMLQTLFETQPQWGNHEDPKPQLIPRFAQELGLDMPSFENSMTDPAHKKIAETDLADGKALGVTGTPTFFVNGRQLEQLGYETLKKLIDQELAR
jgi:protein-disulfide isomerase